jgi:hypothetical protein
LAGKAIDPLAPGGRRPLEGVRDGLPTRPLHDMAHDVAHGGRRGLLGSAFRRSLNLLYLSTQFLWWQAVTAIIGGRSSHTLRHNSRGTWRHSEGSRNVDTTAIRCAFSPLRPCGSSPADVHDCPRGVAPLRHRLAIKDTPGASTGEATTPSPPHPMGCAAHPSILFSPPGHGFSTLDAHWKPLI